MHEALMLAQHAAQQNEVPVGAIVVKENSVIGKGWNCPISTRDPTAHAEIMAIRDAAIHLVNYRIPDTTLYVTLEPCVMCVGSMIHARIKRLVFGAYDLKSGAVSSVFNIAADSQHNHKIEITGGVLAESCGELLKNFFQQRR